MTDTFLSIKNWAEEDRPREKFLAKGIASLSNAELLAILIGSGSRNETAVELCKRILNDVQNNLNELGKMTIADLLQYKGIGEAKAIAIIAATELGRRRKVAEFMERPIITGSNKVFEVMQPLLADLPHEEFWVLFLNNANKVTDKKCISAGGLAGTVVDIRIILKAAIEKLATSIVLCHNHPSGNNTPSAQDIKLTTKLSAAAKLMDITVFDHIIIAQNSYLSFADEGLLGI